MSRAVPLVVSAACVALAGCGASAHGTARPLTKPVYSWSWTKGICGGAHRLDGEGVLWSEEGCENTDPRLVKGPHASQARRAAIVDAFARLPEPSTTSCPAPAHQFQIDAGGRVRTWDLCDVVPSAPLPDPFANVSRAFGDGASP